jgi:hypothetical protein
MFGFELLNYFLINFQIELTDFNFLKSVNSI